MHKGVLKDGTAVAIKIQKPEIKWQIDTDLFMHWLLCIVIEYFFDIPILTFEPFIRTTLHKELDFNLEKNNMEKARLFLTESV